MHPLNDNPKEGKTFMDDNTNIILDRIAQQLGRIADSLEAIAIANAPKAPNYVRPITEYQTFDWSGLGADVVKSDDFGVAQVQWGGYLWTRRAPQNKFGEAIWFSRTEGKDSEGKTHYARLITFKKSGEVEPVPEKVMNITGEPVIDAPPVRHKISAPKNAKVAPRPPKNEIELEVDKTSKPSEAVHLVTKQTGSTVFWMVVERFGIEREKAAPIAKNGPTDWGKAISKLDRLV
jgi:hypothetical protein